MQRRLLIQRVSVEGDHDGRDVDRVATQEDRRLWVNLQVGTSGVGDAEAAVVEAGAVCLALQQLVGAEYPLRLALIELDLWSDHGAAV